MDARPLRIVIIESHPLMREALCAAIASEPGLKLVAETTNGSGSLSRVTTLHPDVILFSLGNPGSGDLEALNALRQALPDTFILGLISDEVPGQKETTLKAGVQVVLTKTAPRAELVQMLKKLHGHDLPARNNSELNSPVRRRPT